MTWIPLQTFPPAADLTALHIYLDKLALPHHFTEELHEQVLWVPDAPTAQRAQEAMRRLADNPNLAATTPAPKQQTRPLALPAFADAPVTWVLAALCVLGYVCSFFPVLYQRLTFLPAVMPHADFKSVWAFWHSSGQYWRLLTPTFLHWTLLHIVFNGLWFIELGKRLESYLSLFGFLVLFLFLAVAGNCAQFWYEPQNPFGGVSAVLYGLFGFIAVVQRFDPAPALALPKILFIIMLAFMLVGFLGVLGPMANAGHFGGLVAGLFAGALYGFGLWLKKCR